MTAQLRPIVESDLPRVALFCAENMDAAISDWDAALDAPWAVDAPNRGFMLLDGDEIVGVYVAYYSEQSIGGRLERFCNLGTWCVLPKWRMHSVRMLKAILAQDDYHFTDLTPSQTVAALCAKLGFDPIDTRAAAIPCLPWPSAGTVVSTDPACISESVEGRDLKVCRDHARAAGALHVLIEDARGYLYMILRRVKRRGLPTAMLLYVSDPDGFRSRAGRLARHLLVHHRIVALIVEERLVSALPRLKLRLPRSGRRMFRSKRLEARDISYLYSELTCLPS